jgi:hypothetical protein
MRELIGTLILGLLVYLAGRWHGYKWGLKEAREDHILCTPEQVVEAVLIDWGYTDGVPREGRDWEIDEPYAQRVAANLVQLTEKGRI